MKGDATSPAKLRVSEVAKAKVLAHRAARIVTQKRAPALRGKDEKRLGLFGAFSPAIAHWELAACDDLDGDLQPHCWSSPPPLP